MARLDLEGRIDEANRALAELLGQRRRRPARPAARRLRAPRGRRGDRRGASAGDGAPSSTRRGCSRPRGEPVPCLLSALARAARAAAMPDVIVVQVQDLRERRRAEAERDAAGARAGRARWRPSGRSTRLTARPAHQRRGARRRSRFDDLVRELLERIVEALEADTAAVVLRRGRRRRVVVYQVAGGRGGRARADEALAATSPRGRADGIQRRVACSPGPWRSHARRAAGASTARRSARCTSARCSPARSPRTTRRCCSSPPTAPRSAIQRARLFQREHGIAEELQRSLLPGADARSCRAFATAARYFAAGDGSQVGGDWYDALVQPDGRLLLVVGDVAGRGDRRRVHDGPAAQRAARLRARRPLARRRCSSA